MLSFIGFLFNLRPCLLCQHVSELFLSFLTLSSLTAVPRPLQSPRTGLSLCPGGAPTQPKTVSSLALPEGLRLMQTMRLMSSSFSMEHSPLPRPVAVLTFLNIEGQSSDPLASCPPPARAWHFVLRGLSCYAWSQGGTHLGCGRGSKPSGGGSPLDRRRAFQPRRPVLSVAGESHAALMVPAWWI